MSNRHIFERTRSRAVWVLPVAAGLLALPLGSAHAVSWNLGPDSRASWTTTVSYGIATRVEEQDPELLANINADDGNRAFEQGSIIQNRVGVLTSLSYEVGNFGVFLRGDAFYDNAYNEPSDNDSASTDNTPSNADHSFVDEAEDIRLRDARLLDAYVSGTFRPGGTYLDVRVGRQVVSWGESTFIPGISAMQGPIDATKSNVAGVEVEEILLPVGQGLIRWNATSQLSFSGYYQWEWEEYTLSPNGGYFSQSDLLEGGEVNLTNVPTVGIIPTLSHVRDIKPDEQGDEGGQYGLNVHYVIPALANTDIGLYKIRYHDKLPTFELTGFGPFGPGGAVIPTQYRFRYVEDIDMHAVSFNTSVGFVSVQGEISHKDGTPVLLNSGASSRADALQGQVGITWQIYDRWFWSDLSTLVAEVGGNTINDVENGFVKGSGPTALANDKSAWGFAGSLTLQYKKVLPAVDLTVTPTLQMGVNGDSSVSATSIFTEDDVRGGISFDFVYLTEWEIGFAYNGFFGDAQNNPLADRDFVSAHVNYSF